MPLRWWCLIRHVVSFCATCFRLCFQSCPLKRLYDSVCLRVLQDFKVCRTAILKSHCWNCLPRVSAFVSDFYFRVQLFFIAEKGFLLCILGFWGGCCCPCRSFFTVSELGVYSHNPSLPYSVWSARLLVVVAVDVLLQQDFSRLDIFSCFRNTCWLEFGRFSFFFSDNLVTFSRSAPVVAVFFSSFGRSWGHMSLDWRLLFLPFDGFLWFLFFIVHVKCRSAAVVQNNTGCFVS